MKLKTTVNEVLGCHVLYDPRFQSADTRFAVRESECKCTVYLEEDIVPAACKYNVQLVIVSIDMYACAGKKRHIKGQKLSIKERS